jgi:hypothetical protein
MTPGYARKVDNNQAEIVEALRAAGASVTDLSRFGHGVPDLLIGFRGVNYLFEVKAVGAKFTLPEQRWFDEWRGQSAVVRTVEQALYVIGAM